MGGKLSGNRFQLRDHDGQLIGAFKDIVDFIRRNPKCALTEIVSHCGASRQAVHVKLLKLVNEGEIQRDGDAGRGNRCRWRIA